jgi:hypothetical protein
MVMPHYFFHILDHGNVILDEEGMELVDLEAARLEAVVSAQAMLMDASADSEDISHQVIEVSDRAGRVLAKVALRGQDHKGPDGSD